MKTDFIRARLEGLEFRNQRRAIRRRSALAATRQRQSEGIQRAYTIARGPHLSTLQTSSIQRKGGKQ